MPLNRSQKRYIKNNVRTAGVPQVARDLGVSEEELKRYLRDVWGDEKFNRVLTQSPTPSAANSGFKLDSFSFTSSKLTTGYIIGALFFLFVLVFIAYFNSLNNAFVSDDNGIPQTRNIGKLEYVFSTGSAFLRPFFYYIAYHLGGLTPIFYRLINVFIHIGSTWLVFLIIAGMTAPLLGFLTAILFAVHPLLVESITWISGGGYAQYTFFFLLALYLYIKSDNRMWTYPVSVLSFLLSMASSPAAASLSLMFPLYEWLFGDVKKKWWKSIPYFICMVILALPNVLNIGARLTTFKTGYYQDQSTYNPLFQIPVALSSYLELMFWPDKLTLYHTELAFSPLNFMIRVLIVIGYFVLLVFLFKKNKTLFFWASIFVISLLPTLTPYRVAWIVAERYVYAGTIGILFLVVSVFYYFGKYRTWKYVSYGIFLVITVALLSRTVVRNIDWTNEDYLWFATDRTSPSSWVNHNNLGDVYARHGNYEKSLKEFQKAIEMNPRYADAYNNMANIYGRSGKMDLAIKNYEKALELNPTIWQSHENLGAIYYDMKQYDLALKYMSEALKLNPMSAPLHSNLGIILMTTRQFDKAKAEFNLALQLEPANRAAIAGLEEITKVNGSK